MKLPRITSTVLVSIVSLIACSALQAADQGLQTEIDDILVDDIALDNRYLLAAPRPKKPVNLAQLILDSGMGFIEVPTLNPKQPSTSFRIRNRDFRADVLAPMRGRVILR
jgi:hypothetical protein